MSTLNYRYIATEIGDLVKGDTSVNTINRAANSFFRFNKETFPNEHITSSRAKDVYDWIMTLAKQSLAMEEQNRMLSAFCKAITSEQQYTACLKIFETGGITGSIIKVDDADFLQRKFHAEIHKHCKQLYADGHYFHAVFEACKAYNKIVKEKSVQTEDGASLMMRVWAPEGVLKITACQTQTDKDIQNGVKFLSAGLMQAIRNPTSHEPAIEWPISKEDCLNILSFMTFLFQKLDAAVYYDGKQL